MDHPDDQKIVLDEAKRLKLNVEEVVGMEHIRAKLKENKSQRNAEAGTPNKSGKSGGVSQGDVEYWIDKKDADGNYLSPDDIDLYEKVSNARVAREQSSGMFQPIRGS